MMKESGFEMRRAQIIDGLATCLQEHSYENTSVKMIAAAAGLAPGLIHYYFKSKDEILLAFVKRPLPMDEAVILTQWMEQMDEQERIPFARQFKLLLKTIFAAENGKVIRAYAQVFPICNTHPELREIIREHYCAMQGQLMRILIRYGVEEQRARIMAISLQTVIEGINAISALTEGENWEAVFDELYRLPE